jgi:SSS family solute:Na+ symporter
MVVPAHVRAGHGVLHLYLRNRISTVPEPLTRRFGPACGDVYSYVILFAHVFLF